MSLCRAETLANIRAISYAIGSLSVEQLVEDSLRGFAFMGPQDILANQEDSWTWGDPEEETRHMEAKRIAENCGDSWPAFRAEVAKLRPFWSPGAPAICEMGPVEPGRGMPGARGGPISGVPLTR